MVACKQVSGFIAVYGDAAPSTAFDPTMTNRLIFRTSVCAVYVQPYICCITLNALWDEEFNIRTTCPIASWAATKEVTL